MAVGDIYTGITVQGLYNEQTGDALYGVLGAAAPPSAVFMAGKDQTSGFLTPISVDSTGKVNVNASISPPSDNTATGTIAFASSTAVIVDTEGTSALMVQLTTDAAYDGKVLFQVSTDGTNYTSVNLYPALPNGDPTVSSFTGTATVVTKRYTLPVGGIRKFQVIGDGTTGTAGNITVTLTAGQGQYSVFNYSDDQANFLATTYQGGSWTVAVSGTVAVTQSTSPWVVSGTVTADAGTGTFKVAPDGTIWALTGTSANVDVTNTVTVTGTVAATQSGSWTVTANAGTGTFSVAGTLTHNNAAPAANNVGVLPALANAAAPTFTEGDQVLLSTDLAGNLRTTTTISGTTAINLTQVAGVTLGATAVTAFGTAPAAANVPGANVSIFQGTAAISAANPLFTEISDGTNAMGAMANFGTNPGAVTSLNTNSFIFNTSAIPAFVVGTLTNNNAAPAANNVGVLPALVEAGTFPAVTLPALTAGDQALVSITQGGSLRVIPADEANAASINYFSADQGDAQTSIANPAVKPLISIRTNSASILVQLRQISMVGGGQLVRYQLIKNATLTGATFAATSPSANTQVDTAATSFSGGTVVDSGYFGSTQFLKSMIYAMAAGTPGDRYTLAASSISGTVKVSGAIQWSEQSAAI